jgi:hypothetical protein
VPVTLEVPGTFDKQRSIKRSGHCCLSRMGVTAFSKSESHAISTVPDPLIRAKEEDLGVLVVGEADHQHPKPLL